MTVFDHPEMTLCSWQDVKFQILTMSVVQKFFYHVRASDVAQFVEHQSSTLLTQVRFPGAPRDFSPRVSFQCRLSYCVCTPPCAITCINICGHVKDLIVHVRVRWIKKILKHPACTTLCCSWLSLGKATQISHGRNPIDTVQL